MQTAAGKRHFDPQVKATRTGLAEELGPKGEISAQLVRASAAAGVTVSTRSMASVLYTMYCNVDGFWRPSATLPCYGQSSGAKVNSIYKTRSTTGKGYTGNTSAVWAADFNEVVGDVVDEVRRILALSSPSTCGAAHFTKYLRCSPDGGWIEGPATGPPPAECASAECASAEVELPAMADSDFDWNDVEFGSAECASAEFGSAEVELPAMADSDFDSNDVEFFQSIVDDLCF